MSTITAPPPSPATKAPFHATPEITGDQRIVIRDVGWHIYETLVDSIGEGQPVRVAYDGRDLEIMTLGYVHEGWNDVISRLIDAVLEELRIPCMAGGQTTWKRREVERGLESDRCYFFDPGKLPQVEAAWARKSNDVNDYPNPDLAIEVDVSHSQIDRPSIDAALRVPEIWRFDGETLIIEQLGPDGSYVEAKTSRYLPIRPDEIVYWIKAEDAHNRATWGPRLREWIRAELAPRQQGRQP